MDVYIELTLFLMHLAKFMSREGDSGIPCGFDPILVSILLPKGILSQIPWVCLAPLPDAKP